MKKKVLSIILTAAVLLSAVIINTAVTAENTGIGGGKKEDEFAFREFNLTYLREMEKKTDSEGDYYEYTNTKNYVLAGFSTDFELEPETEYEVTFRYKFSGWWKYVNFALCGGDITSWQGWDPGININLGSLDLSQTTEWTEKSVVIQTGDKLTSVLKNLSLSASTAEGKCTFEIRDLKIAKVDPNMVKVTNLKEFKEQTEKTEDGTFKYYQFKKKAFYDIIGIKTNIKLKKGKLYAVTFDYKMPENSFVTEPSVTAFSESNFYEQQMTLIPLGLTKTTEWTQKIALIDTEKTDVVNDTNFYLTFWAKCFEGGVDLSIANIRIEEIIRDDETSLVVNGGFENGKALWTDSGNISSLTTSENEIHGGKSAIKLSSGSYDLFYQPILLEKNKNYELTFWYKGKFTGLPNWAVSFGKASMESSSIITKERLYDTDEWTQKKLVFSSGDKTDYVVVFQSGAGCEFYIDDVRISETNDPADEIAKETAPYSTLGQNIRSEMIRTKRYVAAEGKNILTDGGFESDGGNMKTLLSSGVMNIDDSTSRIGRNSLKFEAVGLKNKVWSYAYFPAEPNTEYYLTVWVKGEKWSDTNKNDLRFGPVDPATGKFLANDYGKTDGNNIPAWDNEWHIMVLPFMNGSSDTVAIGFSGGNSVAYFDGMELFKSTDRELYKPLIYDMKAPSGYSLSVEKSSCEPEDNLVENYDFSSSENDFWQTGLSYDFTAVIKDTDSSHGKALFYKENCNYTGYPIQTSYIKWIDGLKKNTDYTFSADYQITKEGNGYLGLIEGNSWYPRGMWQFGFGEESFDSDYKWQKAVIKFNTNDYDRIGIIVCGKGGGAYIDNIRLFESSKGILPTEDTLPDKLESSVYTVKDNMIGGVAAGTTVEQLISKFKNNEYIRAFDAAGKEITDLSTAVGTGTQLRIMDGISVLDKADVIIAGDADGNGRCDIGDIGVLLKYLAKKAELNGLQIKALDVDRNGVVDVNDLALLSLNSTGIKKLSTAVL